MLKKNITLLKPIEPLIFFVLMIRFLRIGCFLDSKFLKKS